MATPAMRMKLSKIGTSSPLRLILHGSLINASGNIAVDTQKISDLKARPEPVNRYFMGVPSSGGGVGEAVVGIGLNNHGLHPGWRFGGFEVMGRAEDRPRRRMVSEEEDDEEEELQGDSDADSDMDFSDEDGIDFDDDDDDDDDEGEKGEED